MNLKDRVAEGCGAASRLTRHAETPGFVANHFGILAITLISKSKPASQFTPTAVQFG